MGDRGGKGVLSTILLLVVLVWSGSALKTPEFHKSHEDALEKGGELTHWNGVDYDFGMFGENGGVEQDKKNVTQQNVVSSNNTSSENENSEEYADESNESDEDDGFSDEQHKQHDIITVGNKDKEAKVTTAKPAPTVKAEVIKSTPVASVKRTRTPASVVQPREGDGQEKNLDYWNGDENDSDDYDESQPLNNLPSDNDHDADKYFNPDRYQDQFTLHQIEDRFLRVWTVQYLESHLPCIMFRGDIRLIVPVNATWFNRDYVEIDVPQDAVASGNCQSLNNDYQEIRLTWNVTIPGKNKVYKNSVYFAFMTNWTSAFSDKEIPADMYALTAITVSYYNGEIGNGDEGLVSFSVSDLAEYMTPLNQSMSCLKDNQQMIVENMQLTMSNVQFEAFRPNLDTLTAGEFSTAVGCAADEVYVFDAVMTYIIWFWIGALLMVLLIFGVLLALGYRRRRCQEGQGGFGYKILSV